MQYLKDEVKEAICQAAVEEFMENNYGDASMRTIANKAGITVGNIYRYFSGKDTLFNELMEPVWKLVTKAVFDNYNQTRDLFPIGEIIAAVMDIYRKYSKELYIMLYKSKGSQYGDVRQGLVELIQKRIENEMVPILETEGKKVEDPFIFSIIANAIVESIYLIIREGSSDFERVEKLMGKMMTVLIKDLYQRL